MKIRSALIIAITAILFLVPAMALGQGTANGAINPSDLTEERPFEIGDRMLILASEHKGRVGEISEILDYSSGTMYVLDGLPHTYPPSDTFYAYDLERIGIECIQERIVGKLVRRSPTEVPTGDLELELMHLKDYAMRLVSR